MSDLDPKLVADLWARCHTEIQQLDALTAELRKNLYADKFLDHCEVLFRHRTRVLLIMERLATGERQPTTAWDHISKDDT